MNDNHSLPEEDEAIAPDIAPADDLPLDPADVMRLEREKYGESSAEPNLEDQEDMHGGQADDIV